MKKRLISLVTGVLVWAAIINLVFLPGLPMDASPAGPLAEKGKKPVEENSFDEVTAKLDKGGTFYLYAGTERLIKTVDEFAVNLRTMLEQKIESGEEKANALNIFDLVYGMIKNSGLMEISGVGISSIALEPRLNRTKVVFHHYKGKGTGLIWNLMKAAPHELPQLRLLPADTVLAGFSDFGLNMLWEWLKKEALTSNLPKLKQGILVVEPMLMQQGIDLGKLLNSIDGMGYVLTLDGKKKAAIPLGKGKPALEFPEPALAIVLEVKDDSLFNLLQSKMPFAQKSPNPKMKMLQIPVPPMPFTVQPVIIQKEGLLVVASNNQIANAMFAAKKSGKGLIANAEFKKLSKGLPKKGNSFRFGSARLSQAIMDIQATLVRTAAPGKGEDQTLMNFMKIFQEKYGMFGVLRNTAEGSVYTMNHGFNMEALLLLPLSVPLGIVAAIAIPNLLTALQKGKQKATMGDMKSIGLAIENYMTDNGKAPEGKTLLEIKSKLQPFYIKTLPLKDAWENDFHYRHGTGDKKKEYAIGSGGKDGVFNGWDQTGAYIVTEIAGFGKDFIFTNGTFTYGPKVK